MVDIRCVRDGITFPNISLFIGGEGGGGGELATISIGSDIPPNRARSPDFSDVNHQSPEKQQSCNSYDQPPDSESHIDNVSLATCQIQYVPVVSHQSCIF